MQIISKIALFIFLLLFLINCNSTRIISAKKENRPPRIIAQEGKLLLFPLINRSQYQQASTIVGRQLKKQLKKEGFKIYLPAKKMVNYNLYQRTISSQLRAHKMRLALVGSIAEFAYRGSKPVVAISLKIYDMQRNDYLWGGNYLAEREGFSFAGLPSLEEVSDILLARVAIDLRGVSDEQQK